MVNKRVTNFLIKGDLSIIKNVLETLNYDVLSIHDVAIAAKTITDEKENKISFVVFAGSGKGIDSVSKKLDIKYHMTFDDLATTDSYDVGDKKSQFDSIDGSVELRVNLDAPKENLITTIKYVEDDFMTYEDSNDKKPIKVGMWMNPKLARELVEAQGYERVGTYQDVHFMTFSKEVGTRTIELAVSSVRDFINDAEYQIAGQDLLLEKPSFRDKIFRRQKQSFELTQNQKEIVYQFLEGIEAKYS